MKRERSSSPARSRLKKNSVCRSRVPDFWGPNFDWYPDQCHGCLLIATLQVMLLQCDCWKIFLCPAWPADWDVSFKLNASYGTTIGGCVTDGKMDFRTIPIENEADVTVCLD